ncbi:MAG TPA: hypothetical protein VFT70_16970 [Nocardioides sp.]|nr:hypothetical protein [Nocardioides sp.]
MTDPRAEAELAELRTVVARAREQAMQITLAARRVRAEMAPLREQLRRQQEETDRAVRDALRNGELGPEQRALAERVVRGETTWHDVLTGADDHWTAVALREDVAADVEEVVAQLREADEDFRAEHDRLLRAKDAAGE